MKFRTHNSIILGASFLGLLLSSAASAETTFYNPNNLPAVQQQADVAHCREVVENAQARRLDRSALRRSTSRPGMERDEESGLSIIVIQDLPVPEQEGIIVDGSDTLRRSGPERSIVQNGRTRNSARGGSNAGEEEGIIIVDSRPGGDGGEQGIIIVETHPADTDPAFVTCMTRRGYTQ